LRTILLAKYLGFHVNLSFSSLAGGWPQNAYKYIMKHGGLPEETSAYDADWLYAVTAVLQGESDEVS